MKFKLFRSSLIKGTLILTLAGTLSRFIGFFYKIFLSRTIGAEALGIYQLIFPLFAFCLALSCGGLQTAISRYTASSKTDRIARSYLTIGSTLSLVLSFCCAVFLFRYADFLSLHLLGEARCEPLLRIMAVAIPFACIHACISGYYYGRKKAGIPSASQLVEQLIRVLGVWLVCSILTEQQQEFTAAIAVWGLVFGEIASALFSLTALSAKKNTVFQKSAFQKTTNTAFYGLKARTSNLCSMAIPLTINRVSLSLAQSLENILIPLSLRSFGYSSEDALSVYGILTGMVFSTIMFPAVLSNSLSAMLLPEIAKAQAEKKEQQIAHLIRKTIESSLVFGFLCTLLFLLGGSYIGVFLFGNHLAGVYIRTLSWISPFLFLSGTLCSILHGFGKPKTVLALNIIGSCIRIFCIFYFVPMIGIRGYLWGMLASQIFTSLTAWIYLSRHTV